MNEVAVDTTVMEKNIAHPTDSRLVERARAQLVDLAREAGIELRQSYARLAPRLAAQVGHYAHARQFRRMRKALRTLKGYTGRVVRGPPRITGSSVSGSRPRAYLSVARPPRTETSISPVGLRSNRRQVKIVVDDPGKSRIYYGPACDIAPHPCHVELK